MGATPKHLPRNELVKRQITLDPTSDPELNELICDCVDMLLSTPSPDQANIVWRVDFDR